MRSWKDGMELRDKFQALVDRFELDKAGARPFDPDRLDDSFAGASHGEKVSIAFLLNVWNPGQEWKSGQFDVIDALRIWDSSKRAAFCEWSSDPWWP